MNMTNKSKYKMKHAVCFIWSIFGLDLLDRFHISRDVDMTIPEKNLIQFSQLATRCVRKIRLRFLNLYPTLQSKLFHAVTYSQFNDIV